jgi:hypothetical protein
MSDEVFIFADWEQFDEPAIVGSLRSTTVTTKEHFSCRNNDKQNRRCVDVLNYRSSITALKIRVN